MSAAKYGRVDRLSELLCSSDVDRLERAIALDELIHRSPAEIGRLAPGLLGDEDPRIRIMAAEAVADLGLVDRLPNIERQMLVETVPAVFATFISSMATLVELRGAETISPDVERVLLSSVEHSDSGVRVSAIQAIGSLRIAMAIPALLNCLNDRRLAVRLSAADTLGAVGSVTEIEALDRARRRAISPVSRGIFGAAVRQIRNRDIA